MKIISWNVNGLRAVERKNALQLLIKEQLPDFLLLQEIKGKKEQFSDYLTKNDQYKQFYHSAVKPGYAGTGIWIRREVLDVIKECSFDSDVPQLVVSDEGRVSHVRFMYNGKSCSILSIYFPNGGKSEQAWKDKLVFYDQILEYIDQLHDEGRIVIVGGDMNVAHTEIDLARPKQNNGKIGFHPDERAWMDRLIQHGWLDVWRTKYPNVENVYTWWSNWGQARVRNVGWRIDYFFMHKKHQLQVLNTSVLTNVTGSDHCPIAIDIVQIA